MSLIKQVKCGRCDRQYSSLRSKCPYCGARKNRGGKRSAYSGNNKWQLIAGIIILVAIIVTVVVLIVTSLNSSSKKTPTKDDPPKITAGEGVNSVTGTPATTPPVTTPATNSPAVSDPGTVTPPPSTATINSVTLNRDDFTLSKVGEQWQMTATLSPADTTAEVTWKSNDENVCLVNATGLVTAVNKGTTTIVATAGGKSAECIVRVTATAPAGTTGSPGSTGSTGGSTGSTTTGSAALSHSDVTIHSASSESFTISVSGASGTPSFASSNASVASVSSSGKVQAVSNGTATIKVTVDGKTLECVVRVVS